MEKGGIQLSPEIASRHLSYCPETKFLASFERLTSPAATVFLAPTLLVLLFWDNCRFFKPFHSAFC
jgi:hypothetical protein